jgi:uncharacterized membrane protein YdjX (TVP38/TMEM64 family)
MSPVSAGAPAHASQFRPLLRAGLFFAVLALLAVLVRLGGPQAALDPAWADAHLGASSDGASWRGVGLYMALVACLSPLGIPRQALAALGGYAFGAAWGTLFASLGLVCGCALGLGCSRFLAREALRGRFGKRILGLERFLAHKPFLMSLTLRLLPVGNNALLTLAAGLSAIPALPFIAGSALGYVPQTLIFALLGSGIRIDPLWRISLSALLFLLASALGLVLYRAFRARRVLEADSPEEPAASAANAAAPSPPDSPAHRDA